MKAAISTKVMPATLIRWTRNAISRGDQPSPGSRSTRLGPSSTRRCQATRNITVGMTSIAFSASTATGDSRLSVDPAMRIRSETIHGMVTRWKKRRMLAKKKLKLSDTTLPNDNFTTGTI